MKFRTRFAAVAATAFQAALVLPLCACSQSSTTPGGTPNSTGGQSSGDQGTGGRLSSSGGQANASGGSSDTVASGGSSAASGGSSAASGGSSAASGGTPVTGGVGASGNAAGGVGAASAGGATASASGGRAGGASGGSTSAGGATAGGANAGGANAGGGNSGGSPGNGTDKITIWLAGDSTMADGSTSCPVGWGKEFQAHFNSNAKVTNSAVGGTTARSWLYNVTSTLGSDGECTLSSTAPQAHWTAMVNGMKAGDYLLIQFGINDTTGAGCPKHVSTATFKQLFGMMAQAAKDKGAQPIFLTAVSSISCNGAVAQGTRGGFATATKDAATQYNVPVIDLEQLSVALYTASGFCPSTDTPATFSANTPVGNFFCNDHTHFETVGATQIAAVVAKAIKDQGFGLAKYLVP